MINYEIFQKIKYLHTTDGLTQPQIAEHLSLDVRTILRWLSAKQFKQRTNVSRITKLEPFKKTILAMLEHHAYSAQQVLQRIREDGFLGSYTIVRQYVRKARRVRKSAFLTLSFAPGECAQVDWGSFDSIRIGETKRRLSFFVMVLQL